jgi:hypothetical protein
MAAGEVDVSEEALRKAKELAAAGQDAMQSLAL